MHPSRTHGRLHYVVTQLAFGGAETQVVELAAEMVRRGWQVRVTSLLPVEALTERLESLGVAWDSLNARRGRWSPSLVTKLVRVVRAWEPDVLHTHTLPANLVGRVSAPLARVPVLITSAHNQNEGGPLRMLFYRLTDWAADITTNCSEAAVARYIRIGAAREDRIRYMPNGVDTNRFAPDALGRARVRAALAIEDDAFVWLAIGRMEHQKDYPNLLAAAASVLRPRDSLLIVGSGTLRPMLEHMIKQQHLHGRVRLLGLRTDIPDLMRAADGYVMSSAWEGLPIVLLEACATALPVVATDVGGNSQIVRPGFGRLVPAHSSSALAEGMQWLRDLEPQAREVLGREARAHVERTFGMRAVAKQWETLYKDLLAAPAGA